jgi:hypothetical protein
MDIELEQRMRRGDDDGITQAMIAACTPVVPKAAGRAE